MNLNDFDALQKEFDEKYRSEPQSDDLEIEKSTHKFKDLMHDITQGTGERRKNASKVVRQALSVTDDIEKAFLYAVSNGHRLGSAFWQRLYQQDPELAEYKFGQIAKQISK